MKHILLLANLLFLLSSINAQSLSKISKEEKIYWAEDFSETRWKSTTYEDGDGYLYDQETTLPEANIGGGQWNAISQGEQTTNRDAMFMHWSNLGPRGRYSENHTTENPMGSFIPNNSYFEYLPEGTSIENGFMLLDSDLANTTESGQAASSEFIYDMDSYLQCGPIDLS